MRGRVHLHLSSPSEAVAALQGAGFGSVRLHRGDEHPAAERVGRDPAARLVHLVEATTGGEAGPG